MSPYYPPLNPYAPPRDNGINDTSPPGFRDEDYTYIKDTTADAGTGEGSGTILFSTDPDADFAWRGLVIYQSGNFLVRFSDGNGYFLSDDLVDSGQFGRSQFGTVVNPPVFGWPGEMLVPAGTPIRIDMETPDPTNPVVVQFQFRGVKRYRQ